MKLIFKYPALSIFLTALLLRSFAFLLIGAGDEEEGPYRELALGLLRGEGFVYEGGMRSWLPPAFGVVLAGFIHFFGVTLEPMRWVIIPLGALSCVWMYDIGKRIFKSDLAGLFCGWSLALYPAQVFWSTRVHSHSLAAVLFIFCLKLLSEIHEAYLQNKPQINKLILPKSILLGLLWALLTLTRGEFFMGLPCLGLYYLLMRKKSLVPGIAFLAVFIIGMAPWVVRNWTIHHKLVLISTNYADNFRFSFHPDYKFTGWALPFSKELTQSLVGVSETKRADLIVQDTLDYIKKNPGRSLYILTGNLIHYWRPYLSFEKVSVAKNFVYMAGWIPLFILFIWGLTSLPWIKNPFWLCIFLLIVTNWTGHAFFYIIVRFREGIIPLIILMAAGGFLSAISGQSLYRRDRLPEHI